MKTKTKQENVVDFFGYKLFPDEQREFSGKIVKELVGTHFKHRIFNIRTKQGAHEDNWVTIFVDDFDIELHVGDQIKCSGEVFLSEGIYITDEENFSRDIFMMPLGGMKIKKITKENA